MDKKTMTACASCKYVGEFESYKIPIIEDGMISILVCPRRVTLKKCEG